MTKKKHKNKKQRFSTPQKIIISVIILAFLSVTIAVICSIFLKPENYIKRKIESLASEYYETYYYDKFFTFNKKTSLEEINKKMEKYKNTGFSTIPLRQLLLHNKKDEKLSNLIKEYCDDNSTYIKIFPEYPFTKKSYHIEYSYSCDF